MSPKEYIDDVYLKTYRVTEVPKEDAWVPLYLNKVLIKNKDNADALNKIIDYCLFIDPTHYFYLLAICIPRNANYQQFYPKKKATNDEEDGLHVRIREALGWSQREFEQHRNIIERTILKDRLYWEKQFGL